MRPTRLPGMGMPIAADPDIWAFAVNQMEMPDTRSRLGVWFARNWQALKSMHPRQELCLWVWSCAI